MTFSEMIDPFTGNISSTLILFTDDDGTVWTVPQGHRFWALYEDWLAQGNTPMPPPN